jgi:hypothetical protein
MATILEHAGHGNHTRALTVKNVLLCQALAGDVKSAREEVEQLSRRVDELQELLAERDGKLESLAKDLEQQSKEKTRLDLERVVMLQYINEESG